MRDSGKLLIIQYLEGHDFIIVGEVFGDGVFRYVQNYHGMILELPLQEIHELIQIEDMDYSIELLRTLA